MEKLIKNNPLFVTFVIPIVIDVVGTVLGQPLEFWTSKGQVFDEAVPIYPLLQFSPFLFILVCLAVWLPITYWLTNKLKEPFNIWAALALLVGHGINSTNWLRISLWRHGLLVINGQYQLSQALSLIPMFLYILLISWIAMKGINNYFKQSSKRRY